MTTPPIAWMGVMVSPSTGALRTVDSSGSRYMISALRNGPMRLIDTNSARTEMVVPMLTALVAFQLRR